MGFDLWNCSLNIWKSIRTPIPKMGTHLGMWEFIPSHSPTLSGVWNVIPDLLTWPAPSQALALVMNPRLGLRHKMWMNKPTHSQMDFRFGSSSLDGLSINQRMVWGIKTHWIEDSLYHLKALLTPTKFNIRRKMVFLPKSVICESKLTHALYCAPIWPQFSLTIFFHILCGLNSIWIQLDKLNFAMELPCPFSLWELKMSQP
jgi:hypothetical protein